MLDRLSSLCYNLSNLSERLRKQKTGRGRVPTDYLPNLFTLCTLQVSHLRRDLKILEALHHFCGFGSATCHGADEVRRAAFNLVFDLSRYQMCADCFLREQAKQKAFLWRSAPFFAPQAMVILTQFK